MNPMLIDVIFVCFLILMALLGYRKGFITRLYDLATTVLVFLLSFWLSAPISSIFNIYHYDMSDPIASFVGKPINQICIFFCILVILFVCKNILGLLIKPLLRKITHFFSLTGFVDGLLGMALSLVEAIMISYIAVLLVMTPLFPQGYTTVKQTSITHHILQLVPSLSQYVDDLHLSLDSTSYQWNNGALLQLALTAHQLQLIDSEQVITLIDEHIYPQLQNESLTLSTEQKNLLTTLLQQENYDIQKTKTLLSLIQEGDAS